MNLAGEGMLTGGKTGMRPSMKEKWWQAAALQGGPPRKAALLEIAGDQEFQGAGDDFEFDGEAGKGLAVDLSVKRVLIKRLADHGVGLVEMHARGAAEVAHPECGQVAQVAKATLGGEGHDFELIFEEVGAGGDFERASVIFGAADDGQRSKQFLIANDNAEMRETVAKDFAGALPPVGQHAKTRFQVEVEGIDDHAVGTGAADAKKILFLFGLFEGSRQSERDFLYGASNELIGRAGNFPGQIQFFGENVGGSTRKKGERNAVPVLVRCEAVDDFIKRAVAAASDHETAAFGGSALRDFGGMARAGGFRKIGLDAASGKNLAS